MGTVQSNIKNKKILFITPYPDGTAPSQRFRIELYYQELINQNFCFDTSSFWTKKAIGTLYLPKKYFQKFIFFIQGFILRFYHLIKSVQYDVIVVHREVLPLGSPIWLWIVKYIFRKRIIYDFDDAIWLPHNSDAHKFMVLIRRINQTKWQIKIADVIYAGNNFLKNYALRFNSNVEFIPTVIDTQYHKSHLKQSNKQVILGWTGSHSTLDYLDLIWPIIQKLNTQYDFKFKVICDTPPNYNDSFLVFTQWNKKTEIEDLSSIDIGVMPLPIQEWAKGKCAFKAIQYMALSIPVIATDYGANSDVISNNTNGFTIPNNDVNLWEKALKKLIENEKLRLDLGTKGLVEIENYYSLNSVKTKFIHFLTHDDKAPLSK